MGSIAGANSDIPSLMGGYFNIVRNANERLGGNAIDMGVAAKFNDCIALGGFMELNFSVSQYTWKKSNC